MATNAATLFLDIDSSMAKAAADQLQKMGVSAGKAGAEADRLAAKFDKNYTTTKKLTQEYKDLDSAFNVGYISAQQYAAGVQQVDAAMAAMKTGATQSVASLNAVDKAMGSSTHHSTNLMFQLQDIGMMMAAGQNPFMLMMQQGSQVSGVFSQMQAEGKKIGPTIAGAFTQLLNPMTAVTFAVIGGSAALVQWAASAWGAETATDSFEDAASNLSATLNYAETAFENALRSTYELRMEYGALAEAAKEASRQELVAAEMRLANDMTELRAQTNDAVSGMREFNNVYTSALRISQDTTASFQEQQNALRLVEVAATAATDEFGLSADRVMEIMAAVDELNGATGLSETQTATARLNKLIQDAATESDKLPEAIRNMSIELAPVNSQMVNLLNIAGQLGTVLQGLFVSAPGMDSGSSSWYWGQSVGDIMPPVAGFAPDEAPRNRGSRGGGGGSRGQSEADRIRTEMEDRVKALQESWLTESEVIAAQYTKDQETLQWALDQKLIAEDVYNQRRVEMTRAYEAEINSIRMAQYSDAMTGLASVFGAMANLQGGNNEKMLKAQRTFAAASALINAYEAGSQVLRDPTLPWFAKIGAAGSIIAAGLGMVSAIKGGGAGGSARASSAAAAPTAKQEPVKNIMVKIDGDEIFGNMAESIMQQIYRQSENGRVIIARG